MSNRGQGKTRREFLKVAAAATATLAGCGGDSDAPAADASSGSDAPIVGAADASTLADASPPDAMVPDATPVEPPEGVPLSTGFGLGIASGDVTDSAAVVWARYDGSEPLRLGVWEMDGDSYVRTVFDADVSPGPGNFIHADVPGLAPGRHHRYAFFEMDGDTRSARSPIGRFRAALAANVTEPLLFAASSCANNGRSFDTLANAGSRDDIDAFFCLGDTVYADGATTIDDYRGKWGENLGTSAFQALRQSTSVLATWDDHEVDNNWNAESIDAAQFATATQAMFEHQPLRRDPAAPDRLWKSIRWGLTAEVFVLDCRGERKPSQDEYISPEQMAWLKQALLDSPAVFKLILNSVPISNFPPLFDLAANDRWEGYPDQRTEILAHIDDNSIAGVLWLAGDFHLCSVQSVDTSGPGTTQIEALVGPADQTGNPLAPTLQPPQFVFGRVTNNYTTIELDPANVRATLRWTNGNGEAFEIHSFDL